MAKIYHSLELSENFLDLLKKELRAKFKDCEKIAIKIHFGENGNDHAFKPKQIKPITDLLKDLGIEFFFFDSSTAYPGPRSKPDSHKELALQRGWGELGEIKTNDDFVEIEGQNMNYEVCKALVDVDGVLVISHIKGHPCTGFGGAIKNLGMGSLTKKTKGEIHNGGKPNFVGDCRLCKSCEAACPIGSIKVTDKPEIGFCLGCSNCIYACPYECFVPVRNYFDDLLSEGAAIANSQFKTSYYIGYLINIAEHCDCEAQTFDIIAKDYGYLIGDDGVASDKAAYDIINAGEMDKVFKKYNKKSGIKQIEAAQKYGMGKMEYELIKL